MSPWVARHSPQSRVTLELQKKPKSTQVLSVTPEAVKRTAPSPGPGPTLLASTADLGQVSSYLLSEAGRRGGQGLGGRELRPSVSPSARLSWVCADIR